MYFAVKQEAAYMVSLWVVVEAQPVVIAHPHGLSVLGPIVVPVLSPVEHQEESWAEARYPPWGAAVVASTMLASVTSMNVP